MFDKQFFEKHQRVFRWLLNAPVIRWWFRWVMCIDQKAKVDCLLPNSTYWVTDDGKIGFDIRTHNKYSKRLYYGFYYLWAIAHFLDMNFINFFVPKWNLGFDSFGPIYPDAGAGSTTCDGYVQRTVSSPGETFANIIANAGTFSSPTSPTLIAARTQADASTSNNFTTNTRGIATFDTSSLGSGSTVDSAILSLYGSAKTNALGAPILYVVASTPASNNTTVSADYSQLGSTVFATLSYSSFSITAYNDITLNASGRSNVSVTGISKFGTLSSWDATGSFTGTWVGSASTYMFAKSADTAGTSDDPKLTGTFTPSGPAPQTYVESISIGDTLIVAKSSFKTLSESASMGEVFTSQKVVTKEFLEAIDAEDKLPKTLGRSFIESFSAGEILNKAFPRTFTESVSIGETFVKQLVIVKNFLESVSINDTFIKAQVKVLSESISANAVLVKEFSQDLVESISASDTLTALKVLVRELTESVFVNDTFQKKLNGKIVDIWAKASKISTIWTKQPKDID